MKDIVIIANFCRDFSETDNGRFMYLCKELSKEHNVEIITSDSTTGMNNAIDGICDIGMASRAVKDSEKEKGLTKITIANDGVAVIVNQENPVDELTKEQVADIYIGEVNSWDELN